MRKIEKMTRHYIPYQEKHYFFTFDDSSPLIYSWPINRSKGTHFEPVNLDTAWVNRKRSK